MLYSNKKINCNINRTYKTVKGNQIFGCATDNNFRCHKCKSRCWISYNWMPHKFKPSILNTEILVKCSNCNNYARDTKKKLKLKPRFRKPLKLGKSGLPRLNESKKWNKKSQQNVGIYIYMHVMLYI